MTAEAFRSWFLQQPGLIQVLVLIGPPLLVMSVIVTTLIGRSRPRPAVLTVLLSNPPHLMGQAKLAFLDSRDESESSWTQSANAQVDDLISRRQAR